ncbi:hypothetical protein FEM48_Zijuj01G0277100 [Ziziphus jujuba var. spinosa]|uniref:Uncharacterized protein n=1 Tax=Ziziphus jujuba var. spinosa TaxID=714518 RepID=A0A978W5A1_ZIZJJ|nr:hypothetical protein FEM48_Zijuj01G0277100 [Ziziphus jujuba var. spinosa]
MWASQSKSERGGNVYSSCRVGVCKNVKPTGSGTSSDNGKVGELDTSCAIMPLLDSPVEIWKNSIQLLMETEFYKFSPELEDHFEIFKHIRGFNVAIVTSANTQDETLPPWSYFLQKDEGKTQ